MEGVNPHQSAKELMKNETNNFGGSGLLCQLICKPKKHSVKMNTSIHFKK
jgi:hypothetical protein